MRPRPLRPGATIGVCAPAGPVDAATLACGVAWLEAEGYAVRCTEGTKLRRGYLAGPDEQRASDLLELVRDPMVGAIVLARAGYGVGRILGRLDPGEFRAARKPIVGFSDATLLLLHLRERARLASIHGPMLERMDTTTEARSRLLALLCGEPVAPLQGEGLAAGIAEGPLVGGSLTMIASSLGTPCEIDTRGAILFFEEVNEEPYAIDRLLCQLASAGKLASAAGVAVGKLVGCASERYPEPDAGEVVAEWLRAEIEGPVVLELPIGHVADHHAVGYGIRARLDGQRGTLQQLNPVVEEEVA